MESYLHPVLCEPWNILVCAIIANNHAKLDPISCNVLSFYPSANEGYVFTGVCLSTAGVSRPRPRPRGCPGPGSGGVSQHALRQTPASRLLLLRTVRILLECILVFQKRIALFANKQMDEKVTEPRSRTLW